MQADTGAAFGGSGQNPWLCLEQGDGSALVMPTFGGPTNIPQLEAFVLGCPVATSRIFGIPEQVGDAALLFDPADVDEIADCVKRLWQDDALCDSLIRAGHERAARWGEQQFAQRLYEYLEEL